MPMAYTDFLDVLDCRLHPDAAPLWDALYHLSKNSHQNKDNDKIRKRNAVLIDILETTAVEHSVEDSFADGWCYHGHLYALHLACGEIHQIQGKSSSATDVYWGFLDFGESSRFEVGVFAWLRDVAGAVSVSPEERARLTAFYDPVRPQILQLSAYLSDVGGDAQKRMVRAQAGFDGYLRGLESARNGGELSHSVVTIGSHFGSNLEPTSLLQWLFAKSPDTTNFHVYGTLYPYPEVACTEFGFCRRNILLEEVISVFVANMYNPSWRLTDVTAVLEQAFVEDDQLSYGPGTSVLPFGYLYVYKPLMLAQFKEMLANLMSMGLGDSTIGTHPPGFYDPDREAPRVFVGRLAGWAREGAQTLLMLFEAAAKKHLPNPLRFVFLGVPNLQEDSSDSHFTHIDGYPDVISYSALRRFRAAVYYPWDLGMCFFNELYAIAVPLFVPGVRYATGIIWKMLQQTDYGWWQARRLHFAELPGMRRVRERFGWKTDVSYYRNAVLVPEFDPCSAPSREVETTSSRGEVVRCHEENAEYNPEDPGAAGLFVPNREEAHRIANLVAKRRREESGMNHYNDHLSGGDHQQFNSDLEYLGSRPPTRRVPEATLWWDDATPADDVAFWWRQTDFYVYPFVGKFESVPHLMTLIANTDFDA
eukprot:g9366.t1